MQRVTILGSTGTIGLNTLAVLDHHLDRFSIEALAAHSNVDALFVQCQKYSPRYAILVDLDAAKKLAKRLKEVNSRTEVCGGESALMEISADPGSDIIVAGIVGAAGLLPTLAAVYAGKRILLANKEPLVMAGALFMNAVRQHQATIIPVDSEHNAVLQCLPAHFSSGNSLASTMVDSIVLTASGGPFRLTALSELELITPSQAVDHPNWKMGAKISVDSATMMNKGLEVIEAHWLFNLPADKIEVVIHPQSVIHSFVRYQDGSTLAQLSYPDMRIPIATALLWPERILSGVSSFNVLDYPALNFEPICFLRYPSLKLAFDVLKQGGTSMCILNAANEIAVEAFLQKQIGFRNIHEIVLDVLNELPSVAATDIEVIQDADRGARKIALHRINALQTIA